VLDAVVAGLSPTSRYHRFHSGVPVLTDRMRAQLAAVDGCSHIAVAAFAGDTPIGIARIVDVGGRRGELAVEVVDAWHRQGVGTRLVQAVCALGRSAGIREVYADVLAENAAAQVLFVVNFPDPQFHQDGPEILFTATLPDEAVAHAA
jgi:RimJ/RimL family protein N-acetyltransferase